MMLSIFVGILIFPEPSFNGLIIFGDTIEREGQHFSDEVFIGSLRRKSSYIHTALAFRSRNNQFFNVSDEIIRACRLQGQSVLGRQRTPAPPASPLCGPRAAAGHVIARSIIACPLALLGTKPGTPRTFKNRQISEIIQHV